MARKPETKTVEESSSVGPDFWRRYRRVVFSGPMAPELDRQEKKFLREDENLRRKKPAKPASRGRPPR